MSDENVPKLRLKPKLAGDAASSPQTPVNTPAPAAPTPAPAAEEAKAPRLKPRLSLSPVEEPKQATARSEETHLNSSH